MFDSFISGLFQEYFDRDIEKKNTATAKINEGGSKKKERNFSKHIYQLRLTMRRATQIEDSYIMITFLLLREQ